MTGTCAWWSGMGERSISLPRESACSLWEDGFGEGPGFSKHDGPRRCWDRRVGKRVGGVPSCKDRFRLDGGGVPPR